ncbi:MAG: hypothetical protein HQL75_02800 [Magnetococcales bacterium]|nr:hypothetical protein [Magnetococcales bacterium]
MKRISFSFESLGPSQWLLLWFIWSLLNSAVYWILGPHSYLRIQDTADVSVPYLMSAARDLLEYGVTWWQPLFSGGMPTMPFPMIDSFLINGLPWVALPPWAAYGITMFLQRFLAAYFTFRLCCDFLRLNTFAALFAGLAFSLNAWSVRDWTLYDGLGPPCTAMFIWMLERLLKKTGWQRMFPAVLVGMGLSLVAETALYTVFLVTALPVWFVLVSRQPLRHWLSVWLPFLLGAVLASMPSAVALMSHVSASSRMALAGGMDASVFEQVWHSFNVTVLERILPDNKIYLLLAALGLALNPRSEGPAWRLLWLFVLCATVGEFFLWLQLLARDVFPSAKGNLHDYYQFSTFSGVLLGAAGLHLIQRSEFLSVRSWGRIVLAGLSLATLAWPLYFWERTTVLLARRMPTDNFAINFSDPVLKGLAALPREEPFRVAMAGAEPPRVTAISGQRLYPAYAFAYGLESADGYYRMYSGRLFHFWKKVIHGVVAQYPDLAANTYKLQYLFAPPGGFRQNEAVDFACWYDLDLLSLMNVRYIYSHSPLVHEDLQLLHTPVEETRKRAAWEMLRRRQMVLSALKGEFPPQAVYLYENTTVLPRVRLLNNVQAYADTETLLQALAEASVEDLRRTAFVERGETGDLARFQPDYRHGEVHLEPSRPDRLVVNVEVDGPAMLALAVNYDPSWRVWINGRESRIIPLYHIHQGVALSAAGKHRIVLEYWPPYRPGRTPDPSF